MSILVDTRRSAPSDRPAPQRRERLLQALFIGFPVWWALGLGDLSFILFAIPMAWHLLRRRPLHVPPGFWLWLLFLTWVLVSIVMLGRNPYGTTSDSFGHRLLPAALKLMQYAAATLMLLYVGNLSERELPQRRIVRLLAVLFGWTVLGGLLGVIKPTFQFTSPVESILPSSVAQNIFVQSLVHPAAAQLQELFGYSTPRPAAPFGYTNTWGNNYSVLMVYFVIGCLLWVRRPLHRAFGLAFLAVSAIPAALSLNRGLWVGLAVTVVYITARLLGTRQLAAASAVAVAVTVVITAVLLSPLGALISTRLSSGGGKSNDLRIFSTKAAIQVAQQAPLTGFGSTRNVLGSPQSIAVGKSPSCPRCGNVALGSNGQIWLLIVSQGFLGATFYVGFFMYSIFVYRRDKSPVGIGSTLVLILALTFMFVYNAMGSPLVLYMIAVALLWRGRAARQQAVTP